MEVIATKAGSPFQTRALMVSTPDSLEDGEC